MNKFPKPFPGSIFYDDEKIYACLSTNPITEGHVVVVWKDEVADLHLLSEEDYEYLMDVVEATRNALLKTLKVEKVYLIYMDEARHVHWHLVPRYNERGYDIFLHKPEILKDISLAEKIRKNLIFN